MLENQSADEDQHPKKDQSADDLDHMLPLVYTELRRLAHLQRIGQRSDETLNTTALVHEAYLRLSDRDDVSWENKGHFFYLASRAMRDILVEYARRRQALKRGGSKPDLSLHEIGELSDGQLGEILDLNDALERLAEIDARQAKTVEMRYFVGLTIPEVADVLDVSPSTVKRDWTMARAWLYREMG